MLILKTFPLSFSILCRFIFVLPLWVIFYIVLTVTTFGLGLSLLGSIPILGVVVSILLWVSILAVPLILVMHPYLVGIRIGLQSLGARVEDDPTQLLKSAVGYGLIEAIGSFILTAITFAAFMLATRTAFTMTQLTAVEGFNDPIAVLSLQFSVQLLNGALSILSVVTALGSMALRAALLPVLASAAAGRGPRGIYDPPFSGFGANFGSMMLLLLMITGLSAIAIPLLGDAFRSVGLTGLLTDGLKDVVLFVVGEKLFNFTLAHLFFVILGILLSLWLFCLQCAGAALSYQSRAGAPSSIPAKTADISATDIRKLRHDRMGG